MKIRLVNGLPIIEVLFAYQHESVLLPNVLLDTGCAVTIFDVDLIEPTGLTIDPVKVVLCECMELGVKVNFHFSSLFIH